MSHIGDRVPDRNSNLNVNWEKGDVKSNTEKKETEDLKSTNFPGYRIKILNRGPQEDKIQQEISPRMISPNSINPPLFKKPNRLPPQPPNPDLNPKNNPLGTAQNVKKVLLLNKNHLEAVRSQNAQKPSTPSPRPETQEPSESKIGSETNIVKPNLEKKERPELKRTEKFYNLNSSESERNTGVNKLKEQALSQSKTKNDISQLKELLGKMGENERLDVKNGELVIVKKGFFNSIMSNKALQDISKKIQQAKSEGIPINDFPKQGPLGFLMKAVNFQAEDLNQYKQQLKELHEQKAEEGKQGQEDIQRSVNTIQDQIQTSKNFLNFIRKNANALSEYEQSQKNLSNIEEGGKIFDQVSGQAHEALKKFEEVSDRIINKSVDNPKFKNDLSELRKHITLEATKDRQIYDERKGRLFMSGLLATYKRQVMNEKNNRKIIKNLIKSPISSMDMVRTVGGSVKKLTDSLIPSFIEKLHNDVLIGDRIKELNLEEKPEGAQGSLNEKQEIHNQQKFKEKYNSLEDNQIQLMNETFSRMISDYKSRGFAGSQQKYFQGYETFINLINSPK